MLFGKSVGKESIIGLYFILPFVWLFYLITEYGIVCAFKKNILKDDKGMPALGKAILLQIVCVCIYLLFVFVF